MKSDLDDFGYGGAHVNLNSDQTSSILELRRAIVQCREGALTTPVNCPVGDSASNGRVENAIKRARGLAKVLKSSLEARWGIVVAPEHPIYALLFELAAGMITRYVEVDHTGKTAVQIIRGSRAHRTIAQFGERVIYQRAKVSSHPRSNMEENFEEGIFLGMRLRSDEVVIGTTGGVIKARSVRRKPEAERWDKEMCKAMRGTPRSPVPGRPGDHIPTTITVANGGAEDQERHAKPPDEGPHDDGDVPTPPVD